MPANLIHHLYRRSRQAQRLTQRGFTLLELLVAILIGGIIISGLLFLVIEMLRVNNREERLTQTQQDMRRALDYIVSDVGEAVFVYSNLTDPGSGYDLIAELDDSPAEDGATPVLAFWRLDPLSDTEIEDLTDFCDGQAQADRDECEALLVRQNTYTLVVYFHQENEDADIWEGQSRIIRYELPAYDEISDNALTRNQGYADPTVFIPGVATDTFNTFNEWSKAVGETTDGNTAVLTDFVNVVDNGQPRIDCPTLGAANADYVRIPDDGNADGLNSFYTCVAQPDTQVANSQNLNKSLIVYLQGNAAQLGRNQTVGLTESSSLPTSESQVLIRGVIQNAP
jgi:prepilin-type N-terminal cleavage/methylation domain-containing protein